MKHPRILLINPWIYDFAAYDFWLKPLGLLSVAAVLKKAGCRVHLIDCLEPDHPDMLRHGALRQPVRSENGQGHLYKQELKKPDCLRMIKRKYGRYGLLPEIFTQQLQNTPRPDAVLMTSLMTYWYPAVRDCVQHTKNVFPDVPVILGGVYATICPEHARANSGADIVFPGLCSKALLDIIERLTGCDCTTAAADSFPDPDCGLLRSKKIIPVLSSRGCPQRCPYCASSILHPEFMQKSPAAVADYVEYWHCRESAEDFVFYDDALLVNARQHFIPLMRELFTRGIQARFHVPNGLHVKYIDDPVAENMRRAGITTVRLSLETIDAAVQGTIGVKVAAGEFTRAVQALKKAGFTDDQIGVFLIAGLPFQNARSVRESILFVQAHGLRPYIAEYSPIPGTGLWQEAVRCSAFPIAREPLFHNNTLLPCQWEGLTGEDLDDLKALARRGSRAVQRERRGLQ